MAKAKKGIWREAMRYSEGARAGGHKHSPLRYKFFEIQIGTHVKSAQGYDKAVWVRVAMPVLLLTDIP